jgi:hypothetical protein
MSLSDTWRQVGNRIHFFTKETSDQIPEVAGCYAWFIPLWNTMLLYEPPGSAVIEKTAKFHWDTINLQIRKVSRARHSAREDQWKKVLADPVLREAFQRALMEASIFMPPLYIGKADNLKVRYDQHVAGTEGANVFNTRFKAFMADKKISLSVSDLLFVCIETDRQTELVLSDARLHELLEMIVLALCKPPFSLR